METAPEMGDLKMVLGCDDLNVFMMNRSLTSKSGWSVCFTSMGFKPTHWMPIPKPPEK